MHAAALRDRCDVDQCRDFTYKGACAYGSRCRFVHEGSGNANAADSTNGALLQGYYNPTPSTGRKRKNAVEHLSGFKKPVGFEEKSRLGGPRIKILLPKGGGDLHLFQFHLSQKFILSLLSKRAFFHYAFPCVTFYAFFARARVHMLTHDFSRLSNF